MKMLWNMTITILLSVYGVAVAETAAPGLPKDSDNVVWNSPSTAPRSSEAKLAAERETLRNRLMNDPALFARGEPFVYRGEVLAAISLPVGGIGAGLIQIDGKARRAIWQIFNNYKDVAVPHSFFAVRAKATGGPSVVRALQTVPEGPFAAMKALEFRGEYPFGWYTFDEPALPVAVSMEVFSPLIPLDARNSSIPCVIFNLSAENKGKQPVEVSFLGTQQNAVGFDGAAEIKGRKFAGYGGNRNRVLKDGDATTLHMSVERDASKPHVGDMALTVATKEATGTASWDTLGTLLEDFATDGALAPTEEAGPSPAGQTIDGALAAPMTLKPGEKKTVSFILTWYFPNAQHGDSAQNWGGPGNFYANWWPDALAVAGEVRDKLDELTAATRLYHDAFYASNLPYWLLDRISSQVAVLRGKTCFWTKDGYFGGWEGCCRGQGCCWGNCNHVWHYAQTHARLFPDIARRMREQEYKAQSAKGVIPNRLPDRVEPAFDGQCGTVLNSYREYCMSADRKWLDAHWPSVKKAMDFVIVTWDKDEDGVLHGAQFNTLDGNTCGSTSWLGTMYLAALAAAEKMAALEGESDAARRYAAIRESGSKKQDKTLFNGEYYIQIPDPKLHEDYGTGCDIDQVLGRGYRATGFSDSHYGTGCHIDQVLGQWWAHQLDLGLLYPPQRVRTALASLFRYNFCGKLEGLEQRPRKFVADDDPGMLMTTWPKGGRPAKTVLYADEVWTGTEYSAAAAMVQAGLLREGFTVVRAAWIRHDGRLRTGLTNSDTGQPASDTGLTDGDHASWSSSGNPFCDEECGRFYTRAMSVWSMLLACQGFIYDGPAGVIGFKPVWKPDDHVSFFTAAEGWGLFTQRRDANGQTGRIDVKHGRLRVKELVFELPAGKTLTGATVAVDGKPVEVAAQQNGTVITLSLGDAMTVERDRNIQTILQW